MKFSALVSKIDACKPGVSEIAGHIRNQTEHVFSGYVLPNRNATTPRFTDEDCELYVADREWVADFPLPNGRQFIAGDYEALLDGLFWGVGDFQDLFDQRKLIFLTGTVGSGKSTFIDYYLRCYCPTKSAKRHLFDEKLIVHCDLKGRQSSKEADARIWKEVERSLKRAGIDPNTIVNFKSNKNPSMPDIIDVLEKISALLESGQIEKRYLVLIFDNIDQSPKDCQLHCLSLVQDIIEEESEIEVWQVFMPMWPETLNSLGLKSSFSIKSILYHEVSLGHLKLDEFYEKKRLKLEKSFADEADPRARRILEEVKDLSATYSTFLRELTYGNMVALDNIVIGLLLSREIHQHQRTLGIHPFSAYRFFDSIISGKSAHYCPVKSKILNPFGWRNSILDIRHILVIPYLFSYFSNGNEFKRSDTIGFFKGAGFRAALINEAMQHMALFNLLHFENDDVVNPHNAAIGAYNRLISEPAVLDNFALITPTPEHGDKKRMSVTNGYDPKQFYRRCITTKVFLKALNTMEKNIDSYLSEKGHNLEAFRSSIPQFSPKLMHGYRERIKSLRKSGFPVGAELSESQWVKLLK